ncbi:hypothetical protein HNE_1146 [Hyphomonas neptunium ATCC 15444]|uniref:Uncharacterized protein n=1 Tax=Hyphomonas neptunium (strain ATCC 15444) TaxID=228405 RepID=Q0C328_HYPNA|nr:hypothetical protein HNE_1146 [Hyphomonas neptunium ATCC 15444]
MGQNGTNPDKSGQYEPKGDLVNAVKKPLDQEPETPAAEPAGAPADAPARSGHHSPVHHLQARIEAAFSARNEPRLMRIMTMVLVVALSMWVAALILQSGA